MMNMMMKKKRSRSFSQDFTSSAKSKSSASNQTSNQRRNRLDRKHVESRKNLPVYQQKSDICKLVSEHEVLLVVAETVRNILSYFFLLFQIRKIRN